jgi:hypothetical protein
MRIATPIGLAAAAVLVGASLATASATTVRPFSHAQISHRDLSKYHAVAVPRANALIGHTIPGIHTSWISNDAKKHHAACIYVSMNLSGTVDIYKRNSPYTLKGTLSGGGWGVAVGGKPKMVWVGSPSNTISSYKPCTGTIATNTVTGVSGYDPYGMSVDAAGTLWATAWPSNTIEWWPAPVSGSPITAADTLQTESYFIDVDTSAAYVAGYNSSGVEEVDACTLTISSCSSAAQVSGGFPGGVQTDGAGNIYLNNQYGTLYSYSGCPSACTSSGSYTYSNGTNPLDYTAIALDAAKHNLWGANIYYCSSSYGLCGDGQAQSLPLSSATLGGATPGVNNDEALGIAVVPQDHN